MTRHGESSGPRITVDSGRIAALASEGTLRANSLGSCIAVAAWASASRVGGLAHVLLPGVRSSDPDHVDMKYAGHAIPALLHLMRRQGADETGIVVALAGGANVLGAGHVSPGPGILRSITEILEARQVPVVAADVGGTCRRTCELDVAWGRVTCRRGDSAELLLWKHPAAPDAGADR